MKDFIQTSSAASFYKISKIKQYNMTFKESLEAAFEDTLFNLEYMIFNENMKIDFVKDAKYFYRKRSDASSTLDLAIKNPKFYTTVLEEGCLYILNKWLSLYGYIPVYVQRTVLYHLVPYFKKYLNYKDGLYFLTDDELRKFDFLLIDIFKKIDSREIWRFNLNGALLIYRTAFIEFYKSEDVPVNNVYIDSYDTNKNMILIHYYSYRDKIFSITTENSEEELIPRYYKKAQYEFTDKPIVYEYRLWLDCSDILDKKLIIKINNARTVVFFEKNKNLQGEILIKDVRKKFMSHVIKDSWFIMDRDVQADDNAEHFYRYMMNNNPKKQCYFALKRDSHDWDRLASEGFELIEFGSFEFENLLKTASKVISSHTYATNYFGRDSLDRDFVFLQHGVTHNDQSAFFNTRTSLKGFITSTYDEYKALTSDNSHYVLTEKEVFLTGMPRYDSLLEGNTAHSKTIVIMPTWRRSIVGNIVDQGLHREKVDNFMSTNYAKHWYSFLNSKVLEQLVLDYGYNVIFAPHAEIEKYLDVFTLPTYIKTWNSADFSMQKLFQMSAFMITDYSSVAFEMAYLGKQTLYYQFDIEDFYGDHYRKDYFLYEEDGFGPVVATETELLLELEKLLHNDGLPIEPYATRIENTFAYRDTNNCQRVYEAITNLDCPDDQEMNISILYDMALSAYAQKYWDLVKSRCDLLVQYCSEEQRIWAEKALNEALFHKGKFTELFESLAVKDSTVESENYWKAKVAFATADWQEVIKLLQTNPVLNNDLTLMLLFSYAEAGNVSDFKALQQKLQDIELTRVQTIMVHAWSLSLDAQWEEVIELLDVALSDFSDQELKDYQPQILMAKASRYLSNFTEAHQYLASFKGTTINSLRRRIEISKLAFARGQYGKCIQQYNLIMNGDITLLSEASMLQYVLSHWEMESTAELVKILPEIMSLYPNNTDFKLLYIRALVAQSEWQIVLEQASLLNKEQQNKMIYPITLSKYRLGFIDQAYEECIKPTNQDAYEYWNLIVEIALLVEDTELAKYCYKGMIAIYPNNSYSDNWSKLNSLRS